MCTYGAISAQISLEARAARARALEIQKGHLYRLPISPTLARRINRLLAHKLTSPRRHYVRINCAHSAFLAFAVLCLAVDGARLVRTSAPASSGNKR